MFTERKISAFQTRISDLPDTPALSAAALKARFDACPEQLRQALNGVCDDGAALEERMDSYQAQTFTGEISESMLNNALAAKLNAKADQSALQTVQAGVTALQTTVSGHTAQLAQKCEIYAGTYTGTGSGTQDILLGFRPKAVLVLKRGVETGSTGSMSGGLAVDGADVGSQSIPGIFILDTGFRVAYMGNAVTNLDTTYHYIAFK